MKKHGFVLLIIILALLVSFAYAEKPEAHQNVFILPLNLQVIEDEAFAGTAAAVVILPDGAESIGEESFAEILSLSDIYIPQTTTYIAGNAFSGTRVTIHGAEGSYADQWAQEHGFTFIHEDIWCQLNWSNSFLKLRPICAFIGAICQLSLLALIVVNRLHQRNRKCVKDYPELHAIDLTFP